ncbi:MAG: 1-deoxy-D-xylulose-5-phosphate reductoisomerase [Gemmatimonadetes bacterium]|nr:1-deoxy-D-xylulose-5-phosphate reductoisomerase [Gemmatimonadota bacterium]
MTARGVAILGATGSIGTSALNVITRHPDRFRAVALTAHANGAALGELVKRHAPAFSGLSGGDGGADVLLAAATHPDADIVLNAVVGAAGLDATLAALEAGKRVALANKESLVVGGQLVLEAARRGGGTLVPVDSEHSAILQAMGAAPASSVRRLVLTASGGPFRASPAEVVRTASVQDTLRHPTWSMGRKITVDSATLANKSLEVIEAHYLFDLPWESIDVVVHPQSIVHSFVEFVDGSVVAQLGIPSMELPILYAFTHPERLADMGIPRYDPVAAGSLTFEAVRHDVFPMLAMGIAAARRGGAGAAVFNAANEVAVSHFLAGRLSFGGISDVVGETVDMLGSLAGMTRQELLDADQRARAHVEGLVPC